MNVNDFTVGRQGPDGSYLVFARSDRAIEYLCENYRASADTIVISHTDIIDLVLRLYSAGFHLDHPEKGAGR
jgi:hypothetical protein